MQYKSHTVMLPKNICDVKECLRARRHPGAHHRGERHLSLPLHHRVLHDRGPHPVQHVEQGGAESLLHHGGGKVRQRRDSSIKARPDLFKDIEDFV